MMNKLALGALLLVAFVLTSVVGVDAQKRVSTRSFDGGALEIVPEANPAANLDQCQNGGVGQTPANCGAGWSNGNANGNNSHYAEGTSIDYRITFSNLVVDTPYTITLGYDTWQNDPTKNAIDYLTTTGVSASGYTVDPCFGVVAGGCVGSDTFPIPDDPCHNFDTGIRNWTGYGMDLTGSAFVSALDTQVLCDVQERQITVSFIAKTSNPVLAWSGHIARAADWNNFTPPETSASSITGSPYHMRIVANTEWGGQQDRSLATTAVTAPTAAPASITGRVTDYYGRGVYGAYVQLFDANTGTGKLAVTNSFGYYRFDDNPVGDFYVMSVSHKRYTFVNGSVSFTLEDNLSGMNFQASY